MEQFEKSWDEPHSLEISKKIKKKLGISRMHKYYHKIYTNLLLKS